MIRGVEEVEDGLLQDLLLLEAEVVTAQTEHNHYTRDYFVSDP